MVRSYVGHGRSMLVLLGSVTCVSAANVGFFKLVNVSSLTMLWRCGGMVGSISWGSMPWNSWHAPLLPALVDSLGYPVSSWPGTSEWKLPGRVHDLETVSSLALLATLLTFGLAGQRQLVASALALCWSGLAGMLVWAAAAHLGRAETWPL